jgi:hypothetical protein
MSNVADLPVDGKFDEAGDEILCFYGKKSPQYAAYRTKRRVLVQFADDKGEAARQRSKLAPLWPVRGEINGLVDGWRVGSSHNFLGMDNSAALEAKAARYDRRVGDALIVALEEDVPTAQLLLDKIKEDILNERVARARFEYLVAAFASALALMFTAWLLSSIYYAPEPDGSDQKAQIGVVILVIAIVVAVGAWLGMGPEPDPHERADFWRRFALSILVFVAIAIPAVSMLIIPSFSLKPIASPYAVVIDIWRAAAAGAVGAFFSISLAIRGRTILPDLLRMANLMDAVLRVTIGFIAGAVILALILSHVVNLQFDGNGIQAGGVLHLLIAGFAAGFSERLVPDLLDKASVRPTDRPAPIPVPPAQPAGGQSGGGGGPGDAGSGSAAGGGGPGPNGEGSKPGSQAVGDAELPPEEAAEDACIADMELTEDEATPDDALPPASGGVAPDVPSEEKPQ